jgi:hypothetical protein
MALDKATLHKLMTGQFVPCSTMHPKHNCIANAFSSMPPALIRGMKVYSPIHIMQLLLFNRKDLTSDTKATLCRVLFSIFRSSLFISCFNLFGRLGRCLSSNLFKGFTPLPFLLCSTVSTLAIYFETPKRRDAISMYLLPRSIETCWQIAERSGIVKSIAYGEVGLFAVAMGVLLSMYSSEPKYLTRTYFSLFERLLGDN